MMSILTTNSVIFATVLHLVISKPCTFTPPCACSTDDYTLDLSPLMSSRNDKEFSIQSKNYVYYLHPCNKSPLICKDHQLTGCQFELDGKTSYGIASLNTNLVYGDPDSGKFTIENYKFSAPVNRTSYLNVYCSDVTANLTDVDDSKQDTYIFTLHTRYGCHPTKSGGLSVGSVLVILFFVLLLIYLVGGVLFLKYVRKAEGIEVIPNVEFWKDLPSLIKDGILFTCRGCKTETTYEKI